MRTLFLILAVPAIASAQTTNTNCMANGQWINCTTQGAPGTDTKPVDFLGGLGVPQRPAGSQEPAPIQYQAAWAHVADLIKAHRCDEAIDFAIRQGGTEAGLRTKQLCQ